MMTPRSWQKWIVLAVALALIVPTASVAFALVDEFGGASFATQYAPFTEPYEWGPVIHESDLAPYAPFTEPYVPLDSTHYMIR